MPEEKETEVVVMAYCGEKAETDGRGVKLITTVAYDDFVASGSLAAAREKGLLRSEGKDYIVQEGDVMLFRFNV
ncbi:YchF, C-terminal domain [Dillenia turbinata]|uniref:YchF, C-terminal domain n=1 Tax=Dillenia turbinata TaxID=194707 RepID=A0AAN8WEI7_9MAGN